MVLVMIDFNINLTQPRLAQEGRLNERSIVKLACGHICRELF